jgi:hypothetical protein
MEGQPGPPTSIKQDGQAPWVRAIEHVAALAFGPPLDRRLRVSVHFHPDRLFHGVPLLHQLAADGVYRSQFETLTSNGGLTAHEGGDRWRWEHRIFGGVYDGGPSSDRPKYGSLNHRLRQSGGSVRFGSAHLRLAEGTLDRTTFCYPDSTFKPSDFGTAERMPLIALADSDGTDFLDDYVEAQVHGPLLLASDVEALVLDPSHRGTEVEEAAAALPFPVTWHQGFRLHVDELAEHTSYRGAGVVKAGRAVAVDGWLDARIIGSAVAAGQDPQTLKRLWHTVARFGVAAERSAAP